MNNFGFIKVAAVSPRVAVADCKENLAAMKKELDQAVKAGGKIVVFPELCLTGYTLQDLFYQQLLVEEAKVALEMFAWETKGLDVLTFVGLPFAYEGKLYNVAAACFDGRVIGLVPKCFLPNYSEFYEARHFTSGRGKKGLVYLKTRSGEEYPVLFAEGLLFKDLNHENLIVGCEICEDLWVADSPSTQMAKRGATILVNLSASDEIIGKAEYRKNLVAFQSAKTLSAYVYADAGKGESSTDFVFSGHNLIVENATILDESPLFSGQMALADVDLDRLANERRRTGTFEMVDHDPSRTVDFRFASLGDYKKETLKRLVPPMPFVPADKEQRNKRCEEILSIQALGLAKRLSHTHGKSLVIGISGGLDSTLALLVAVKALDYLKKDRKDLIAVTMPGFGTTDRTYHNAVSLVENLGAELREISIVPAVLQHFKDINHDQENHDVTYENAQARQRTYLLMDIANQTGGLVVGTGDLSELALGWATYNGDHMSMYGVNASVPKTLVRHLVRYYADTCKEEETQNILFDILDTPVSPELLPPKDGKISQKTEDLVGPYELHDFFLYYVLRYGYRPKKIYYLAKQAYEDKYDSATILKWLRSFYWRFFAQQFKRSCLPDGPKVGSVAVSPRGDLKMPSDAISRMWIDEVFSLQEELEEE